MKTISEKQVYYFGALLYFIANFIDGLPGQILVVFSLAVMLFERLKSHHGRIDLSARYLLLYIFIFTVFCFASRLWAENPNLVVSKFNSLVFIFFGMVVISGCLYREGDIDQMLKVFMYGSYMVVLYFAFRYGWGGIRRLITSTNRLLDAGINPNSLGMSAAYAIVINLYFIFRRRIKLSDLLILPAIVVLAASGSRKAAAIVVLGILGLYIMKNISNWNILRTIGRVILVLLAGAAVLYVVSRLPAFSNLSRRVQNLISLLRGNETRTTSDAWIRLAYDRLGMRLFREHPILGIGIANANIYTDLYYGHNHYLHNNYVELLACGGLVGFLIYYLPYLYLLIVFWKNRKHRDAEYNICFVLLVIRLIIDYGLVAYYSKSTYLFLLLFWMEARRLEKKNEYDQTLPMAETMGMEG